MTDDDTFLVGQEAGRLWAEQMAGPRELEMLAAFRARSGEDWPELFQAGEVQAYSPAERLFFEMHPDEQGDRMAAADFWDEAADGAEASHPAFARGFTEAALKTHAADLDLCP